eukprot:NODE_3784_length_523_cov_27.911392_g3219_i0.p1 GENE.NODE_3784_length_523_cov_27.911392_g3219_i0~~NODE_3784_length_523_cov_27.911392_g3219_i0.p1  ORF type:complete len:70 (-),score=1.32 NODE_3784_length_523_cov_27.911392_g3219_i0:40-249(-)
MHWGFRPPRAVNNTNTGRCAAPSPRSMIVCAYVCVRGGGVYHQNTKKSSEVTKYMTHVVGKNTLPYDLI